MSRESITWHKGRAVILTVATAAGLCGCAAIPALTPLLGGMGGAQVSDYRLQTSVDLSQANYRVVRSNLFGESRGLTLLLFLTVDPTSHAEAFSELDAQVPYESGRAYALVNVVHERSSRNFLLFALPKIRIRADLVEFLDPQAEPHPDEMLRR